LRKHQNQQNALPGKEKNNTLWLWIRVVKIYKLRYFTAIFAGLLAIIPSALLVLLVTYAISSLQGAPRHLTWSELVGEHASRWIGPIVRKTSLENGLSLEFQRLFVVPVLVFIGLVGNGLKAFLEYSLEDLGERISRNLRNIVTNVYLTTDYRTAQGTSGAMIASFLGEDTREIRQCFTRLCGSIPVETISTIIYLGILALLDTQLFILFFTIFLPAGIVIRLSGKYLRNLAKTGVHIQTELTQSFLEKMKGWQGIKTFNSQTHELNRFEEKNFVNFNIWRRAARAKALSSPTVEWLGISAGALVLILALRRVSEGALPSSILTAFLVTVAQLSTSLQTIVTQLNTTKKGNAALRRIFDYLDNISPSTTSDISAPIHIENNEQKFISATEGLKDFNQKQFSIELKSLSVTHNSKPDEFLCKNISTSLSNGDILAITGASGSGKSTLLECITGLRRPHSGDILLEMIGERKSNNPLLPELISVTYLSQEPFVFEGTIFENVIYPEKVNQRNTDIQQLRAINALKMACLSEKNLSERAVSLSGGEKQRLAFARGFYLRPDLWIVDEGTSALDSETEAVLMKNLTTESTHSIKIFVAHRQVLKSYSNKQISL
jgi:ABC-type multidrug transport system fused ATPase/permease subunit